MSSLLASSLPPPSSTSPSPRPTLARLYTFLQNTTISTRLDPRPRPLVHSSFFTTVAASTQARETDVHRSRVLYSSKTHTSTCIHNVMCSTLSRPLLFPLRYPRAVGVYFWIPHHCSTASPARATLTPNASIQFAPITLQICAAAACQTPSQHNPTPTLPPLPTANSCRRATTLDS